MRDVLLIDDAGRADVLVRPGRAELLQRMVEPRSCGVLAQQLGTTPQKVHYHVKALERAGLVEQVSSQKVRGFTEASYQAAARSYWLSPRLVQRLGGELRTKESTSRGFLLNLAEEMHIEVGRLGEREAETPTLGLSAHIALANGETRAAFMDDLQAAIQQLARKYGGPASPDTYRLVVACYPGGDATKGETE
jgi:DNA-binding transcriptional ArsR family regulator